jgi:hypothetical protein
MITMIMISRAITMMTSADHRQQHKSMQAAADTSMLIAISRTRRRHRRRRDFQQRGRRPGLR